MGPASMLHVDPGDHTPGIRQFNSAYRGLMIRMHARRHRLAGHRPCGRPVPIAVPPPPVSFSRGPTFPSFRQAGAASSSFRGAGPDPICSTAAGEVAEWPKAAVLKTVDPQGSGGSNPSLSATIPIKTTSYGSRTTNRTLKVKSLHAAPWRSLSPSRPPKSLRALLPSPDRRPRVPLMPVAPLGADRTRAGLAAARGLRPG